MKWPVICLVAAVIAASGVRSNAAPPMPSFRYYGMLHDEYGWPVTLDQNVVVTLMDGTNECARYTVNEQLGDGINYILEVPIDYAARVRYASYAARTGDVVIIRAYQNEVAQPLMNTSSVPNVGSSGDAVRLDLTMGTDSDGDGMSDEWETQMIIAWSDGLYTDISQVLPGDDFDGDHSSNLEEFHAGSMPYAAEDVFQVYKWMKASDGTFSVKFYAVKGATYAIYTSPSTLKDKDVEWSRSQFRTSVGGSDVLNHTATATDWCYFYVPPQTNLNLIRLEIAQ